MKFVPPSIKSAIYLFLLLPLTVFGQERIFTLNQAINDAMSAISSVVEAGSRIAIVDSDIDEEALAAYVVAEIRRYIRNNDNLNLARTLANSDYFIETRFVDRENQVPRYRLGIRVLVSETEEPKSSQTRNVQTDTTLSRLLGLNDTPAPQAQVQVQAQTRAVQETAVAAPVAEVRAEPVAAVVEVLPEKTPQFVVLQAMGNDDSESLTWLLRMAENRRNPDSSRVQMTFFVNAVDLRNSQNILKRARRRGHEFANMTFSNFLDTLGEKIDARLLPETIWYYEISKNDSLISKRLGVPRGSIVGFRAPRFEYNEAAFRMLVRRGFKYDSSIEEFDENQMPYDLKDGSRADSVWVASRRYDGHRPAGRAEGLWQLPAYQWTIPHDSLAGVYGFAPGLRRRAFALDNSIDTVSWKIRGTDVRAFGNSDIGGLEMRDNEVLATIKYSFDLHREGSNAPFTFSITPSMYGRQSNMLVGSAGDYRNRRKIIEAAVDYMLSFENVRFFTGKKVVGYMKNNEAKE